MKVENKKYFVDQLNSSKANKFTENFHYSGTGFKKAKINLGVFKKENSLLVGVLQWGCSAQESIRLDRYVKESIQKEEYLELNRFCMDDDEGRNSESQAISLGIKWIQKNRPEIKLLVSYAGRKEGNYGYIYQATNWEYLGYFISNGFWRIDGEERHKLTLWNRVKNVDKPFLDALKELYSNIIETKSKQFIYIQRLDKKLTPASETLPYPKPSNEFPIVIKEIIHKEDKTFVPKEKEKEVLKFYYDENELLFSKQTLRKRGELGLQRRVSSYTNMKIARYSEGGYLEYIYNDLEECCEDGFKRDSVQKAIRQEKLYLKKHFRMYQNEEDVAEQIDVPIFGIIDEIPFAVYADAAKYLGISRQAVHAASKRKSKQIVGKNVIWC